MTSPPSPRKIFWVLRQASAAAQARIDGRLLREWEAYARASSASRSALDATLPARCRSRRKSFPTRFSSSPVSSSSARARSSSSSMSAPTDSDSTNQAPTSPPATRKLRRARRRPRTRWKSRGAATQPRSLRQLGSGACDCGSPGCQPTRREPRVTFAVPGRPFQAVHRLGVQAGVRAAALSRAVWSTW